MTTRQKHWFFFIATIIGAVAVVSFFILLLWSDMSDEERIHGKEVFGRVVIYGSFAMIVLFFISSQFILYIFRNYISPIETLTEETRLIALANAKYRIKPVGALETHHLTSVINDLADSYISLKSEVKNIVTESKAGFEDEKLRLEALMDVISEGVIICSNDGRILMANQKAYEIFNSVEHNEIGRFTRLGIGKSLFSVLNRVPLTYAMEELYSVLKNNGKSSIFNFITTRYKVQYLEVKISSIVKKQESNAFSGYIITFNDITQRIKTNQFDEFESQPIILDEISSIVNMRTNNHFNFITENGIWTSISNLKVIDFLMEFSEYLKEKNVKTIGLGVSENNNLQINWKGSDANFKSINKEFDTLVLNQNSNEGLAKIELKVPVVKQANELKISDDIESRPIFYDSELVDYFAQSSTMDEILLRDLTFVVFDTETTGLDPSGGDEIISIAGVRVHKGKIIEDEIFDELVNPQRSIPLISLEIHEIYPEMLKDKLTIEKVLPLFHEFADNTILVAHNAAFDMRFIQLKEKKAGVEFKNPVLDTLLLSAICHPKQELHNLEDLANKCGVEILGRHTALGDAIVTAEVFLKLIPILEAMGIKTLGEARKASAKTHFSNLKF
jgi:DNA polymerase III epsilon subunit family exonuclease